uniref:Methyltransferase small domain-containing protein n=1 Tax=Fagus sylvatica TaxID=28930 RepID=A0A2N9G3T6_FAGSY
MEFQIFHFLQILSIPATPVSSQASNTAGQTMPLCLLSTRPPSSIITCHVSPGTLRTNPSPPSPPSLSLPPTPLPSLTCALHCPHFESCSGCTHEFNLHRPIIVEEATDFFKTLGVSDFTFDTCRLWEWRCRAKLAVRGSVRSPLIGLYQEGTHNVVDIPNCKAHHPNINATVELLRQGIIELNVEPYDEDQGTGWRHLLGERDFWEHVGGIDIALAPSSFGQANTRAFDILLRKLQKYVPFGASVSDLYAGAGVIGLSLAATRKCRSVKCIEINKESKLSFEKTADRLPKFVDSSISWHHADAAKEPLSWMVGSDVIVVDPPRKGLDTSLVDALQNITVKLKAKSSSESSEVKDEKRPWILRAKEASVQIGSKTTSEDSQALPETLIYISCGWESFKEDCKLLLSSKAWHLEKAHGYNFFPGTQSIEVLAVFKRGQGVGLKKKKLTKKKKKQL